MMLPRTPDAVTPRHTRRLVVLLGYGGLALTLTTAALTDTAGFSDAARLTLIVPLALATLYGVFRLAVPGSLGLPSVTAHDLDERQLRVRNAAYLTAFRILGALAIVATFLLRLTQDGGATLASDNRITDLLFWGAFLLVVTLPNACLAWTEPDSDGA